MVAGRRLAPHINKISFSFSFQSDIFVRLAVTIAIVGSRLPFDFFPFFSHTILHWMTRRAIVAPTLPPSMFLCIACRSRVVDGSIRADCVQPVSAFTGWKNKHIANFPSIFTGKKVCCFCIRTTTIIKLLLPPSES